MASIIIQIEARCGHATTQEVNPGTVETIRQVAAMFPCRACQAAVSPFGRQRKMGRGRGSSR